MSPGWLKCLHPLFIYVFLLFPLYLYTLSVFKVSFEYFKWFGCVFVGSWVYLGVLWRARGFDIYPSVFSGSILRCCIVVFGVYCVFLVSFRNDPVTCPCIPIKLPTHPTLLEHCALTPKHNYLEHSKLTKNTLIIP